MKSGSIVNTPEEQEELKASAKVFFEFKEKYSGYIIGRRFNVDDLNRPFIDTITAISIKLAMYKGVTEIELESMADFESYDLEKVLWIHCALYYPGDARKMGVFYQKFMGLNPDFLKSPDFLRYIN